MNFTPAESANGDSINQPLRAELLAMEAEDLRVRAELAADGSLFDGYHPQMEAVHRRNAVRVRKIIAEYGWPGERLVGTDGANAAWLIVQHAIGEPSFMRSCLVLLQAAIAAGDAPAWQAAYLDDRIRVFEGRPQLYATQFDINAEGWPEPYEIEAPEQVEERRRTVGLKPLAEQLQRAERATLPDREAREQRDRGYQNWLYRTGWRV